MNVPLDFLHKMCSYEVEIHGVKVKAHLADWAILVDTHIYEIYKFIFRGKSLVALDVKTVTNVAQLVILGAGTEFLIIQLHSLDSYPLLLDDLFSQAIVCFVGVRISDILSYSINIKVKIIKICVLIQEHGLKKLAQAAGITLKQSTFSGTKTPPWSVRLFSAEQIRLAIHDAYTAYVIGSKLLEQI
ncbi:hypothetical protein SLEP1_g13969 [Rubroshorea leprosula]|uniref:3'-5' exonuclease domain-containing protein n=1 Tax=Rubroshorea leprosula TaxID=152421 RepID=A0AAV5IND8_9ROSI|nr:hypothetical protein SLEP1_g13969 [Rubroshorea leprosula]